MADATIEDLSQTKKRISITVPKDESRKYLDMAYRKVGGKARLNGFRPGKIPQAMLDRHYGEEIAAEWLNALVDETYPKAIHAHNLIPVSKPEFSVTPVPRDSDYRFGVEIEVKPNFTLKPCKGVNLSKVEAKASGGEIAAEMERLRENMASLEPAAADAILSNELVALIDFEGRLDGASFEGGASRDYLLQPGRGQLLPEFEAGVAGMKAGETRSIAVTFPPQYPKHELAGKHAEFTVTLKSLHHKKLPALDDELARDAGKKDLAELRTEIEKIVLEAKKPGIRREYMEQIRRHILSEYDFEVPEGLISDEARRTGRDRNEIIAQIRYEFVLEAIAVAEKIEPSKDDVDRRLAVYSQIYRRPLAEIRQTFLSNRMLPHLMSGILIDKALDYIITNANIA